MHAQMQTRAGALTQVLTLTDVHTHGRAHTNARAYTYVNPLHTPQTHSKQTQTHTLTHTHSRHQEYSRNSVILTLQTPTGLGWSPPTD